MNRAGSTMRQLADWFSTSRGAAPTHPDILRRATRYWHTARYLTPRQMFHQMCRRVRPVPLLPKTDPVGRLRVLNLRPFPDRATTYDGEGRFCFLNQPVELGLPVDWAALHLPHLWRYHLHSFDCLGQRELAPKEGWKLIRDWIVNHPPRRPAVGWEPYPLSIRVVNWLKFLLRMREFPEDVVASLALQGANLERQVEHHLLGNHLFVNGKALWWLGAILDRERWRQKGQAIVRNQLGEQFLPDGGHFELSPMYHALLLEDLLDLVNLTQACEDTDDMLQLSEVAGRALSWLSAITDSTGTIPLLNDSAHGIARPASLLRDYAAWLGVFANDATISKETLGGWTVRNCSGYRIARSGRMRLVFDSARLGPDYLPGHAHADLLSVLLDMDGRSLFTDTGVFEYAEGPARSHCRSVAAHNTVSLDDLDQAELWKSFRVGLRGHAGPVVVEGNEIRCAHDGFARQRRGLQHERRIQFNPDGFRLLDDLTGPDEHRFVSRFHLAPDIKVTPAAGGWVLDGRVAVTVRGADIETRVETTPYCPEFGRVMERPCLILSGKFRRTTRVELLCTSFS